LICDLCQGGNYDGYSHMVVVSVSTCCGVYNSW